MNFIINFYYFFLKYFLKNYKMLTVLQTDTGNWVEHTKVLEVIIFKELGKITR